jgi:hypothetical protein
VRRYWVLGMECSLLEIQKLAWFLERSIERVSPEHNPLELKFVAHKYGPYANRLDHLLNSLDGSYLRSEKRISDADPLDVIWFDDSGRRWCASLPEERSQGVLACARSHRQPVSEYTEVERPFLQQLAAQGWT